MAAGADAGSRRAALETATVAPERGGGSCVLCCGDLEATALGRCDHPVCYRCSTKMRVLCEQRYCAVCREELRQVRRGRRTARSGRRAVTGARPSGAAPGGGQTASGRRLSFLLSARRLDGACFQKRGLAGHPGQCPGRAACCGASAAGRRRWQSWVEEGVVPLGAEPGDLPAVPREFLSGHGHECGQSTNSTCSSVGVYSSGVSILVEETGQVGTSSGNLFWKHRVKRGFSSLAVFLAQPSPPHPTVLRLALSIHWVELALRPAHQRGRQNH